MNLTVSASQQPPLFPADWCQRWRAGRHSWRHRSEGGFDARRYSVVPLQEQPAKSFVAAHHYARSFPAARLCYGLVEADELVGAVVLGVPMSAGVLTTPFPGLRPYAQSLELSRLVLLDRVPANAESWFTARALNAAADEGIRGVVMFSDPMPRHVGSELLLVGHVGFVYQALGCLYTGRGTPRTLTVLPDGSVLPARAAQKVRRGESGAGGVVRRLVTLGATSPARRPDLSGGQWLAYALRELGANRVRHRGNHRYVLAIGDRGARRRTAIALPPLAYPKLPDRPCPPGVKPWYHYRSAHPPSLPMTSKEHPRWTATTPAMSTAP